MNNKDKVLSITMRDIELNKRCYGKSRVRELQKELLESVGFESEVFLNEKDGIKTTYYTHSEYENRWGFIEHYETKKV